MCSAPSPSSSYTHTWPMMDRPCPPGWPTAHIPQLPSPSPAARACSQEREQGRAPPPGPPAVAAGTIRLPPAAPRTPRRGIESSRASTGAAAAAARPARAGAPSGSCAAEAGEGEAAALLGVLPLWLRALAASCLLRFAARPAAPRGRWAAWRGSKTAITIVITTAIATMLKSIDAGHCVVRLGSLLVRDRRGDAFARRVGKSSCASKTSCHAVRCRTHAHGRTSRRRL